MLTRPILLTTVDRCFHFSQSTQLEDEERQ